MNGGYKDLYDPRATISRLLSEGSNESSWDELFENLHHQGDLGEASYAAIPLLIESLCTGGSSISVRDDVVRSVVVSSYGRRNRRNTE